MSNWQITIIGDGDIDTNQNATEMGKRFVQELVEAGHTIQVATIVNGSVTDLDPDTAEDVD